jgi:1-acyl-sn-glycerol-3-phosphate acyltransferase
LYQAHLFTRCYRVARIIIHTFLGLMIAAFIFPVLKSQRKLSLIKWWCGGLLRAFGIQLTTFGKLPAANIQNTLFVANHISWADIHALNSQVNLRFIAKSDIQHWPIFGYLVSKANTLFIDRAKRQDAGKIVKITTMRLLANDNLCFFPEGTTTDGTYLLPFKSSVLQAAINANSTIWPVAIRYINADGSNNARMAYAGETTMGQSVQAVLREKNPMVELHFLAPFDATNGDRRALALQAFNAIKNKLHH